MRKTFTLILLGGLLFFGAQSALANNYLKGSWDSFAAEIEFVNNVATVTLTASETPYEFGIRKGDEGSDQWRSSGGNITSNVNGWWFNNRSGNTTIKATITGVYTFIITGFTNEGKSYYFPIVDVIYPEAYTARESLTVGNYGTICLAKKATSITGATLYSIYGKDASTPTELYLVQENAPFVAGRPYIYKATATSITTLLEGNGTSAGNYKGLYGTFESTLSVVSSEGNDLYILSGNKVVKAGSGCYITNGRAYIKMADVDVTDAPTAPSAIRFDLEESNATNLDAVDAPESAVKFIQSGQLFILRNGVKYDAMGRVVK